MEQNRPPLPSKWLISTSLVSSTEACVSLQSVGQVVFDLGVNRPVVISRQIPGNEEPDKGQGDDGRTLNPR